MAITLEAIRAAGGIVHSDGNIFFRDISMLQGLAGAAGAAPAQDNELIERVRQAYKLVNAHAFDLPGGDAHKNMWLEQAESLGSVIDQLRLAAAPQAPAAPAVDDPVKVLSQAARDVLAERRRQVEAEGWTPEHDDQHDEGEMCFAAAGYAAVASDNLQAISRDIDRDLTLDDNVYPPTNYPWPRSWEFKPCTPRRALVKSGALILAEIERIDRCSPDAAQAAAKGEHAA